MKRRKLEAESNVAQAKANAGLKADLYLRFGLTQTAENFSSTYRHPLDQQAVSIGITLPILDWGKGADKCAWPVRNGTWWRRKWNRAARTSTRISASW